MVIEWDLEVESIRQEHSWMILTCTNNKQITMSIEEWIKLKKPGKGDTLFVDIVEVKNPE